MVASNALGEGDRPPPRGAGTAETLPAPESSGAAGPVVINGAGDAEDGGLIVTAAEVAAG